MRINKMLIEGSVRAEKEIRRYSYVVILIVWFMPGAGLEPAHHQVIRDFKSLASTSSATPAFD